MDNKQKENKMGTELSIQETIATKIRKHFLDLFPEEKFTELVDKEIKTFTEWKSGTYGRKEGSLLEHMINDAIKDYIEEKLKKQIKDKLDEIQPWNTVDSNDALKNFCKEMTPSVLEGLSTMIVTNAMRDLQQNNY